MKQQQKLFKNRDNWLNTSITLNLTAVNHQIASLKLQCMNKRQLYRSLNSGNQLSLLFFFYNNIDWLLAVDNNKFNFDPPND